MRSLRRLSPTEFHSLPYNYLLRRCANLLSKLLRTENLRAFSTLDLVDSLQSQHEAFTLLYSMAKELHHSH